MGTLVDEVFVRSEHLRLDIGKSDGQLRVKVSLGTWVRVFIVEELRSATQEHLVEPEAFPFWADEDDDEVSSVLGVSVAVVFVSEVSFIDICCMSYVQAAFGSRLDA